MMYLVEYTVTRSEEWILWEGATHDEAKKEILEGIAEDEGLPEDSISINRISKVRSDWRGRRVGRPASSQ